MVKDLIASYAWIWEGLYVVIISNEIEIGQVTLNFVICNPEGVLAYFEIVGKHKSYLCFLRPHLLKFLEFVLLNEVTKLFKIKLHRKSHICLHIIWILVLNLRLALLNPRLITLFRLLLDRNGCPLQHFILIETLLLLGLSLAHHLFKALLYFFDTGQFKRLSDFKRHPFPFRLLLLRLLLQLLGQWHFLISALIN